MQVLAALAASVLAVGLGHGPTHLVSAESSDAEAYVAVMDQDWNVTREIRVPCSIDSGCSVDLGLDKARVRVVFDAVRGGQIAVTSVVESAAGTQTPRLDATIGLDRTGFGAQHLDVAGAQAAGAGPDQPPILLMAVKVPGWALPLAATPGPEGHRT